MSRISNFFRSFVQGQQNSGFTKVLGLSTALLFNEFILKQNKNIFSDTQNHTSYFHSHQNQQINSRPDFINSTMLISGSANRELSEEIAFILGVKLADCRISKFADGEIDVSIQQSVRGKDCFIVQSTSPPVNDNLVELLLLVSTLRQSSARQITLIVPYYGYSRFDKRTKPRTPISAADVAIMLETIGIDRMVNIDLHSGQIQGFYGPRVPVDNLEATQMAVNYMRETNPEINFGEIVIVSPDAAGVYRAKKFQEIVNKIPNSHASMAMIISHRQSYGKPPVMNLVGDVNEKNVLIVDDIIDSGSTLVEASQTLKQNGAQQIIAFGTHGLFNGEAYRALQDSYIQKILTTNTIPSQRDEKNYQQIQRLSIAPLLAQSIFRIQQKQSLENLYYFINNNNNN